MNFNYDRRRSGATLIEVLVIVAIIAILIGVLLSVVGRNDYGKNTEKTGTYVCVKTYTVNVNENKSSKRVDLRPVNGGPVETFECDDSWRAGISNSATLYAQFEAGRTYTVTSRGVRTEGWWATFPLVVSVSEVKK
jgi:competence protein ComGC